MSSSAAVLAAGPFLAACALLAVSGIEKLRNPQPARATVAAVGGRVPLAAVVGFGAVELAAGVVGAIVGGIGAFAVAVLYLALGGFAWRLLRRAPNTPCACLGSSNAPASRLHVVVNFAAAAFAIAAGTGGSPIARLAHHAFPAVMLGAFATCCVALVALAFDALPQLQLAVKENAT